MHVLFIYRGYGKEQLNSVIDFQKKSLQDAGVDISVFTVERGGLMGYIQSFFRLRLFLSNNKIDVLHAHYAFSAIFAGLATSKPVICSIMGSDILQSKFIIKKLIHFFCKFIWFKTIVKSEEMQRIIKQSILIPNGVDMDNFKPISKEQSLIVTNFNPNKKHILFIAQNPLSYIKNLQLAQLAVDILNRKDLELHVISNKSFDELPFYYNAADLLLLTSISEGSPNVIKEAMACNCPIVATNVGDVQSIIANTEGCYITSFDPKQVANDIEMALNFNAKTLGRKNINQLDSKAIALKIKSLYELAIKA